MKPLSAKAVNTDLSGVPGGKSFAIAGSVGLRCLGHSYFNWIQDRTGNRTKAIVLKLLRLYPSFRPFQVFVLERMGP